MGVQELYLLLLLLHKDIKTTSLCLLLLLLLQLNIAVLKANVNVRKAKLWIFASQISKIKSSETGFTVVFLLNKNFLMISCGKELRAFFFVLLFWLRTCGICWET